MMLKKALFPVLAWTLLLTASAQAQSIATDSAHYYEGLPYNFISTAPRAGTFYYNDFNRYELSYTNTAGQRVEVRYFGGNGGTGGDKDYNGAAIIGQDRGVNGTFSGAFNAATSLRRVTTGPTAYHLHINNTFDPGYAVPVSGAGLPAGTAHEVGTFGRDNTIGFSSSGTSYDSQGNPYPSSVARFSISTVGFENIQLSFDLAVGLNASVNYAIMASADGGVTWTYTQNFYNLTSAQWYGGETGPYFDFSSNPEFANNPSFVFQMVAIKGESGLWENSSGTTSADDSSVGNLGLYFDRITLSGDASAIPEPATCAALLGASAGFLAWYRRRARA